MIKCADCGKENIRPFSGRDGKVRCENCAVKFYNTYRKEKMMPVMSDIRITCSKCGMYHSLYTSCEIS